MAVVMTAILITTVCLSAVWWITLRDQQINARLDYLTSEAQDIAYLASFVSGAESNLYGFFVSGPRQILNRKAEKVNDEFIKNPLVSFKTLFGWGEDEDGDEGKSSPAKMSPASEAEAAPAESGESAPAESPAPAAVPANASADGE